MSIKQIEGYTVYLSQVLGRGSYGLVYKGYKQLTNEPVAVKIIPKAIIDDDRYLKMSLQNQIKIMQTVESDYIVGFLDVMETSKNYYIIQELCEGDLTQIIRHGQQLTEGYCIDIITQICQGFLALVKEGVIHRDLKPANILKKGGRFKIADFGFSKQLDEKISNTITSKEVNEHLKMNTVVGTPLYMSLELLKATNYTSKCDIWALGFIFYELLHGQTPWNGVREFELVQNIEKLPLKIKRRDLSKNTVDFLERCLQKQEKDRISWNQIFVHPIFKGRFLNKADENKEYENKMKGIMRKLRYYFHLNRQKLEEYLTKYGYKDSEEELSFESYFQFLRNINSNITQSEAYYIFKKTDLDGNGAISLDQILQMLKQYGIALQQHPLNSSSNSEHQQASITEQKLDQVKSKLIKFFNRLYRMIEKNSLTLRKVFNDFDKSKKGYMVLKDFKEMAQKVVKQITDDEALIAFRMIDYDGRDTISYTKLEKYFCLMNDLEGKDFK